MFGVLPMVEDTLRVYTRRCRHASPRCQDIVADADNVRYVNWRFAGCVLVPSASHGRSKVGHVDTGR